MAVEQKGRRKRSKGCKEQLIIHGVVMRQTKKHRQNLHATYIDYRKAFHMIPHSWLLRILEIHTVHTVYESSFAVMKKWRNKIQLCTADGHLETEYINIFRGIFQGDALSAVWFCKCLNPLSNALNGTKCGFQISNSRRTTYMLNHLLKKTTTTKNYYLKKVVTL